MTLCQQRHCVESTHDSFFLDDTPHDRCGTHTRFQFSSFTPATSFDAVNAAGVCTRSFQGDGAAKWLDVPVVIFSVGPHEKARASNMKVVRESSHGFFSGIIILECVGPA